MMIRSVVPNDLLAFRRKPSNQILLFNDASLIQPHRPFWFSVRCLLQGMGKDRTMKVYHDAGVRAFAQAQGRSGRPEQDISYLATYEYGERHAPSDHDIWFRLLERICMQAGGASVQRLYTAIWTHQLDVREIFRQLGFQAYTNRSILQLNGPDWDQGTTLSPMWEQSRRDAWAIHKLYGAVTPPLVQQAEVRTPRAWALPRAQWWHRLGQQAWVLGAKDNLHAYLHVLSGPNGHLMCAMIHPSARDQTTDIVRFGLSQLLDSRPVFFILRDYHQELLTPLQKLGFQTIGEQTLLVKNITVSARRSIFVPAFESHPWDVTVTIPTITASGKESNQLCHTNLKEPTISANS